MYLLKIARFSSLETVLTIFSLGVNVIDSLLRPVGIVPLNEFSFIVY